MCESVWPSAWTPHVDPPACGAHASPAQQPVGLRGHRTRQHHHTPLLLHAAPLAAALAALPSRRPRGRERRVPKQHFRVREDGERADASGARPGCARSGVPRVKLSFRMLAVPHQRSRRARAELVARLLVTRSPFQHQQQSHHGSGGRGGASRLVSVAAQHNSLCVWPVSSGRLAAAASGRVRPSAPWPAADVARARASWRGA